MEYSVTFKIKEHVYKIKVRNQKSKTDAIKIAKQHLIDNIVYVDTKDKFDDDVINFFNDLWKTQK